MLGKPFFLVLALGAAVVSRAQSEFYPAARLHVKLDSGVYCKYTSKLKRIVELNFTMNESHQPGKRAASAASTCAFASDTARFHYHDFGSTVPTSIRQTLSPADIDMDGDMDFFTSSPRSRWYENAGAAGWVLKSVSDSSDTDVGAAILDVDGDGRIDRVAGSFWYRNRKTDSGPVFDTFRFQPGLSNVHDQLVADIDGDGRTDVLDIAYDGIRWYRNPSDPTGLWRETFINNGDEADGRNQHGGIAVGDIDGDGDQDVSRLNLWFENADGKGLNWVRHPGIDFGRYWSGGWGLSGRAAFRDLDLDGSLDLIQGDCDNPAGMLAIFFNRGGKGLDWERRILKDSAAGQDFHSLTFADFDGDGDEDIFSMGGANSDSLPTAYIWENTDGKGGDWSEREIYRGEMDGHESVAMDVDNDGDMDIMSKSWSKGVHFWLENTRISVPISLRPQVGKAMARGGPK